MSYLATITNELVEDSEKLSYKNSRFFGNITIAEYNAVVIKELNDWFIASDDSKIYRWNGSSLVTSQDTLLTENSVWVGNSSNVAEEQATTGVLSGKATLIGGTATISNASILATSSITVTATTTGTLTGFLRCTISAGSIVVESRDASNAIINTDSCEFSYLIII